MEQWKKCQNILCIRPDNLGDVLMTTPALRALKDSSPGCKLTLLTSPSGAGAAAHIEEVEETIIFKVPWVKTEDGKGSEELQELVSELKRRSFDGAIIFTVYSQNPLPAAMICYMADIPQVLGYCRENPYRLINNWVPDPEPLELVRHEVQRQLDLVAEAGFITDSHGLSFTVPDEARKKVSRLLRQNGLNAKRPWLVMHTGVSEAKRLYPAENFVTAASELLKQGVQVVLSGSKDEVEYVGRIQQAAGGKTINLAGELSVAELAALIEKADVLVSNNTGPVHISAAVGTPVVVTYAKTNPQHTPWQVPSRVLYFDVPANLRSKNKFLQSFPGPSEPAASPQAIVRSVNELLARRSA